MQFIYHILLPAFSAFLITYFAIPNLIEIARVNFIYAKPNERSSHTRLIPYLGGAGIFLGLLLSFCLYANLATIPKVNHLLIAIVLIFSIGLKDDLVLTKPLKKLLGQFITASFVVSAGIQITSFQGVLGITEIPYIIGIGITILTITYIINAFNLIDGINGLSAGIGICLAIFLGGWFFMINLIPYTILSFSMAGALMAFLIYNRTPAEIFMGDSGSLLIGLLLAILLIEFVQQHNIPTGTKYHFINAPLVAIGLFTIPIFDFLRVAIERFIFGKSPMSPDRKHIHHLFVDAGYSHNVSSLSIVGLNIVFTIMVSLLQGFGFVLPILLLLAIFWILISYLKTKVILNKEMIATNKKLDVKNAKLQKVVIKNLDKSVSV